MNKKIIVVENESPIRNSICLTLKMASYPVISAENPERALELLIYYATIAGKKLDLLITELKIQNVSAFDILNDMQSYSIAIPMLVIVEEDYPDEMAKLIRINCAGFIRKPINPESLTNRVTTILENPIPSENSYLSLNLKTTAFKVTCNINTNIITPSGDITTDVSDSFLTLILDILKKNKKSFLFDFKNVTHIAPAGIKSLFNAGRIISYQNSRNIPEIINICPKLQRLFNIIHMDNIYFIKRDFALAA